MLLADEQVTVNGEVETRRGRQLHAGRRGRARRRVGAPDLRAPGMTPGVYVAGCEPATGKSAVALGVQQLLTRRVERLGVFRPGRRRPRARPADRPAAAAAAPRVVPYEASCGVGYEEVRADEARALEEIVARYRALAAQCDGVLVVGTDFAGDGAASELAFNARVGAQPRPARAAGGHGPRAHAGGGRDRDRRSALTTWRRWGPHVVGVVANRVRGFELDAVAGAGARRAAGLRAAGGRPADGADGRRRSPRPATAR